VQYTSNILVSKANLNDANTSNYVLATSNILVAKANLNDSNTSNYVLYTSNILVAKSDLNDSNTSNYVLATSNILVAKTDLNDTNTSNYVLSTSNYLINYNNLINKPDLAAAQVNSDWNAVSGVAQILNKPDLTIIATNNTNVSNYVQSTSNILVARANLNNSNNSNYVQSTSNILVAKANLNDANTSNYVLATSNYLINYNNLINKPDLTIIATNDSNTSNYVLSTSNVISKRITDLTTSMIYEDPSAANKFIVNNKYNTSLLVNGDLTINSNLIVLGESTTLQTIVYTTERMEVVNDNNTAIALMIQQKDSNNAIFVASNLTANVFTIANNGDVNIAGNYKK
jgi:hypothetical protein